jgi:PAS domain S-box-containing protein
MKTEKAIWIGGIVFVLSMLLTQSLTYQQYLEIENTAREKAVAEANRITGSLTQSLSNSLSATRTLSFYVEKYGVPEDFESIGAAILESNKFIDAVELTRNGVITHVYPLKEHRSAIGYDILSDTLRNQEALKAIAKRELFFAGPFQLRQGGLAVVGRLPIFRDNDFWGFSVVLIRLPTLLRAAGISQHDSEFVYQLSKRNPNTGQEEFFLEGGPPSSDDFYTVSFPEGDWTLYVRHSSSGGVIRQILPFFLLGFFLSSVAALLAYQLARQPEHLRQEVDRISLEIRSLEKVSKESLERANQLYRFISQVNHVMIHADSEKNLYSQVCRIACEIGKYELAWIGMITEGAMKISNVCNSGNRGYLEEIAPISIGPDSIDGPGKRLIQTGSYFYCNDIEQEPLMARWAPTALKYGYRSMINLPIKKFGEVVGMYSLYSNQRHHFDDQEIRLLLETSENISFTLENFRREELRKAAENQIQAEKVFSDSIINSLPGVFYLYDSTGKFYRWNKNFQLISGYSADEIKDMHPLDFFNAKEKMLLREKIDQVFSTGYAEVMADFYTKDESNIPYYFSGRRVNFQGKDYLIGMGLDITDRVRAEQSLIERTEEIEKLSAHLQSIREEERSRIALEIHDVLGQQLTALKMDTSWVRKRLTGDKDVADRIGQMITLIDDTIKIVRRISTELRPGILDDLGIVAAIEWQGSEFQKTTGVEVQVLSNRQEIVMDSDLSINVFRIYQEALTNVARHANATRVRTILTHQPELLQLEVIDDGAGIDYEKVKAKKSLGLISMKERARLFNGVVTVEPSTPKGTVVKLRVPLFTRKQNMPL